MGNFDTIKQTIDANIKTNGNQEITGQMLNSILNGIVSSIEQALLAYQEEVLSEAGEKYGNYITNSEFLRAYVDANGVLLWGIRTDGSIHWATGIPEHVKDYIDSQVPDKELFNLLKSANSEDYDGMSEITMDAEQKLLSWRDGEGVKHEHVLRIEKDLQFSKTAISNFMQNLIASGFTLKNPIDLSDLTEINIPIPSHCAVVNIISSQGLATTKTQDLHCELEYLDKGGNYFKKYIVLNAQGQSSMKFIEKNQSIDIYNDAKREEACDITFGNWVTQDSYHLKCYYIDVFRGICNVAYKWAEEVIKAMDSRNNRVKFNRADISTTQSTGDFATDFTDRALCHPDGFPFELYLNGEYYGLYAWNLKKHRANYSMKKNNYKELILDGIIDNSTFFNGVIKWSDIELRNPKTLITMGGAEYNGDNPQELIDASSASYNPNNTTHVKTAQTKAIMVELSNVLAQIIAADNDDDARQIFEEHFDVKAMIAYFIASNVIYHYDGFAKNWIWTIYDGIAAPTLYDADSIFGRTYQGTEVMPNSVSDILGDSENTITGQLIRLYKEEMDDYYKMLKDKGIVSVEAIMRYVYGWLESATYAAIERNLDKWYSIPSYRESKTMNDGSVDGGMFDSPRRVHEWLKVRLGNLDNFFNVE